ncbi:hypothetical protein P9239_19125 [Caballeronia sp. LZ062]|uniref:hypothetical protein n=1 Tax=unclassified Caballeronia TaxID=2646786 RepID=UPI002855585A|nr:MULTISPECIES: hypothetical protein [unclassified Caballeronia]MDR5855749.1 hypothetical protein [Caballeronia sp. LZ050]MDR5872464.1 hypothetical protein [Caballeronia sp. LZ062]
MRKLLAAFLAACALPLLAQATTAPIPDPTDASASTPAVEVPSAFSQYMSFKDSDNPSWQQLNREVAPKRNGAMLHSVPTGSASAEMNEHQHGSRAK